MLFKNRQERKVMSSNTKFAHFKINNGYATVASVRDNNVVYYGVAFCSPNDQFCKRVGRQIAMKKLFGNDGTQVCDIYRDMNPFEYCEASIIDCLKNNLPPWLKDCDTVSILAVWRKRKNKPIVSRIVNVELS